ncbi:MAG: hypothetical protein JRI44_07615 [Deltaproteobacteria bacterium]|nr:hypothetical protein [Deltaproteobacteria bacterium]
MKRKMRVYLDTSVISALLDERNPKRKTLTEAFFAGMGNSSLSSPKLPLLRLNEPLTQDSGTK